MKRKNGPLLLCVSFAALTGISGTLAANQGEQADTELVLEEVIVTSQRREERLINVPLSVSAINERALIDINATNFEDYARAVPSLSFVQNGRYPRTGVLPIIRGIATVGGLFPTTSVYLGETPVQPTRTRFGTIDTNLFDVERVEVLRGPQGDLYGSSSMGGAIKIIPNRPQVGEFDMAFMASLGTFANGSPTFGGSAMLNIPLAETAALRLTATYRREGGYIDSIPAEVLEDVGGIPGVGPGIALDTQANRDFNNLDTVLVRAALRWEVTENLTITPSYFGQEEEGDGTAYNSGSLVPIYGSAVDVDYGLGEEFRSKFDIFNLEIQYDMGWATLLSSTTRLDVSRSSVFGATGVISAVTGGFNVPTTLSDLEEEEHFVQEVRISTTTDWPVEFTAGIFYRDVDYGLDQYSVNTDLPFPFTLTNGVVFIRQNESSPTKEKAIFARATWHVTDRFDISPGIRYSDMETGTFIPTTQGLFGYPTIETNLSKSKASPSISARYSLNDETSFYARVASGFRPGYASSVSYPPPCFPLLAELGIDPDRDAEILPDELWNYELGVKGRFLDGRLSANLSVYRIDWTDLQLTIPLACGFGVPGNAGEVRSTGTELEMQMLVTENLTAQFSFGYNDVTVREDVPSLGGTAGDRLPNVPKYSFSVGGQYNWTVASRPAFARLDYAYNSDAYYDFSFSEAARQPALGLMSGRLGFIYDAFEIALYGKNLLNEDKLNMCARDNFRTPAPDYGTCIVRPRELGIQVRWTP